MKTELNTNIIYMATSPSGKVYIGRTSRSLEKRKYDHNDETVRDRGHGCPAFCNAIRKYSFNSIKWEILHENLSYEESIYLELREIRDRKADNADFGYNLLTYTDQIGIAKHSEITKKKISDAVKATNIAAWQDPKRRLRASKRSSAVWHDKQLRKQMTDAIKKVRSSDEQRKISSIDSTKRYSNHKKRDEMAVACGAKEFTVIDKNGNIVGNWVNAAKCAKDLGFATKTHISNCLHGRIKTYKGYSFVYKTDSI